MSDFAYIALIDVLAYRSRLEKDQKNGTHEFKDDLTQALLGCRDINTEIYGIHRQDQDSVRLSKDIWNASVATVGRSWQ